MKSRSIIAAAAVIIAGAAATVAMTPAASAASSSTAATTMSTSPLSMSNSTAADTSNDATAAGPTTGESDTAVAGTPPNGLAFNDSYCSDGYDLAGNWVSTACFEPYGDKIWVYDARSDGHAADGYWMNWLVDGTTGKWTAYRDGDCWNSLTAGHWGYCNKDFYENSSLNYYNGYGSGIRIYAQTSVTISDTYQWVVNDNSLG